MGRKILIVDKSLYNRMILRDILLSHGFSVSEASTGAEAIEFCKQSNPDVVAVDATMPGSDGLNAIREIKLNNPDATVLMCGTRGQQRFVMEGMSAGADGVILKPFNEKQIVREIRQSTGQASTSPRMS